MSWVEVLRIIGTWIVWVLIPFQIYSVVSSHRILKQYTEKNRDLDRLIGEYQKRLKEMGKGNPFEDFE